MNETILKIIICGSGWAIFIYNYFHNKNNQKKELEQELKELKKELLGNIVDLIELHHKNATDQDYYLVKDRIINLIELNKNKIDKQYRIDISDMLEELLYKLRNNEPYRDKKRELEKIIANLQFTFK